MWSLGIESSNVIGLRMLKFAQGGAAGLAEADLMVREKVEAGMAIGQMAMLGGLGTSPDAAARKTVAHYRRRVRANARRLSKH
jgi:hypothetical protein